MVELSIHRLKTWTEYYVPVAAGLKTFEVRREDDRHFKPGDALILEEYIPEGAYKGYTGKYEVAVVTYCLRGAPFVPDGYVIMGFKIIERR